MLELAGSSVVDWVQGLVTKALSELHENYLNGLEFIASVFFILRFFPS